VDSGLLSYLLVSHCCPHGVPARRTESRFIAQLVDVVTASVPAGSDCCEGLALIGPMNAEIAVSVVRPKSRTSHRSAIGKHSPERGLRISGKCDCTSAIDEPTRYLSRVAGLLVGSRSVGCPVAMARSQAWARRSLVRNSMNAVPGSSPMGNW